MHPLRGALAAQSARISDVAPCTMQSSHLVSGMLGLGMHSVTTTVILDPRQALLAFNHLLRVEARLATCARHAAAATGALAAVATACFISHRRRIAQLIERIRLLGGDPDPDASLELAAATPLPLAERQGLAFYQAVADDRQRLDPQATTFVIDVLLPQQVRTARIALAAKG